MEEKNTKKVNKGGRPPKYNKETPSKVREYLDTVDVTKELPTRAGFAVWLGINQDTVVEWSKTHKAFSVAIKELDQLQAHLLQSRATVGKYNPTMSIFLLKNNHGFKDKQDVDVTTAGEPIKEIIYTAPGE